VAPNCAHVQLNEATIWAGEKCDRLNAEGTANLLDLDIAIVKSEFNVCRAHCTREGFTAALTREQDAKTSTIPLNRITLDREAIALIERHADERKVGTKFRLLTAVAVNCGTTHSTDNGVIVNGTNSAVTLIAAATNFKGKIPDKSAADRLTF
jgi:hypothetical protein